MAQRTEELIKTAEGSEDAQTRNLASEVRRIQRRWPWLVRLQILIPELDALDGVRTEAQEKARHMAYKGLLPGAVHVALRQASRVARKLAKEVTPDADATSVAGEQTKSSPDLPWSRVHQALESAVTDLAASVKLAVDTWTNKVRAKAAATLMLRMGAALQEGHFGP